MMWNARDVKENLMFFISIEIFMGICVVIAN